MIRVPPISTRTDTRFPDTTRFRSYSSAKAALIGLTRTLAKEWGRFKVNVNCVSFGYIETRLTEAIEGEQKSIEVEGLEINVGVQPQLLDTFRGLIPLGRGGPPEVAAEWVYLFCSPESTHLRGQVLVCGGGLIICGAGVQIGRA